MKYSGKIIARNGKEIYIRNGLASDGSAVLDNFNLTHAETDYLLSYPDENRFDSEQEGRFLERKTESPNEIELIAFADGKAVGCAGIERCRDKIQSGTPCRIRCQCVEGILGTRNRSCVDRGMYSMCKGRGIRSIGA